jgi:ABC-type multidrug transport system fused ATPase/permease subunit
MAAFKRLWSKIFFSEMNAVLALGERQSLSESDLPALPEILNPRASVVDEAGVQWTSPTRLLPTLMWASRRLWYWPTFFYAINAALNLSGPVLVNHFVRRLQAGVDSRAALLEAALYGVGVGFFGMSAGVSIQHYFFQSLRRNQVLTNMINTRLFRHALVLSKSARERTQVGDIVNHMSSDTDAVSECPNSISDLMYCSILIFGGVGLLFHYLGATAWVAVILLGFLAPITRTVSKQFSHYDEVLMKFRDQRVSLMSQILSAVRLVKYFAWENSVRQEVEVVRTQEIEARRQIARAELMVTMVYVSIGTFVLFAVLAVHSWRGFVFDPALIFTCVSLFTLLEDPFAFMSRVVSTYISARVAAERIARFLSQPVVAPLEAEGSSGWNGPVGLNLYEASVRYPDTEVPTLEGLSLRLAPGQSLAVVGAVGSGKSTLLHAILGELPLSSGDLWLSGVLDEHLTQARISYVPQEAYILNGSLRENLVFGGENVSDEEIFRALELAGLSQDVQALAGGLKTEIGEKGVNLSGGQRQRLSLARAILHRPQLVILDDPLSAVDANTEAHLVHQLLFGEWREVTRVVVTHRLTHLREFDRVAFLADGHLQGVGSVDELEASSAGFRAYMDEYARAHAGHAIDPVRDVSAAVEAKSSENTRITEDEDREFGAVRGSVYWDYILSLGGLDRRRRPWILFGLVLAAASGTAFPLLQKSWLAFVSNAQAGTVTRWSGTWLETLARTPLVAIYIYGGFGLLVMAGTLFADLFWLRRGLAAGRNIHDQMLKSILGATIRFFDATPVGRILQRFSRDMEAIDIQLQWSFENSMKCLAQVVITLTLIVSMLPMVLLAVGPVLIVYYRVQRRYRASAREAKRMDSIARSPRYAHFKETLQGLSVIRAYGKREWFLEEFYARLSHSQRMFYGHYMVNRWFSSRIPIIGGLVSMFTALSIVWSTRAGSITSGTAGLLTVYSLSFWGVLNWGIRIWSEVEARMTSMERVKTYSRVPQEKSLVHAEEVPSSWPSAGAVSFDNVSLRYAEHLPLVLKGLSFDVAAGSKVGIVGRTGSGKSTLFQALYRFVEVESGRIRMDGVDIASVPLARLRRTLAIIPQDPTLFMGSLRSNLDRYGEYSDAELWAVLERTCLSDFVRGLEQGLNTALTENGANLSQGQRQLLCLARALLTQAKVIILDEATASVDVQTDAQVQRVVRESCAGVTMLIIAHRLGTVRDCDQILEIADGRVRRQLRTPAADLKVEPRLC